MQSAGAAAAWQVDTQKVSYMSQLIVNWSLTTISYPLLLILVLLAVKDNHKDEEGTAKEADSTSADTWHNTDVEGLNVFLPLSSCVLHYGI